MVTNVLAGLGVITVLQAALLWRCARALGRLRPLETRLAQVGDAVALLTDTTESAFRAVATEISQRPATPARRTAAQTARVARAAKKGQSIPEIAVVEKMAEGEVRLRLHMANDTPVAAATKARRPRKEKTCGPVRLD